MPASVGYYLADITALKAIDSSIRTDGYIRAVGTKKAWYIFFSTASDSADDDIVVQPTSGTGRWFKVKSLVLASEIPDLSEFIDDRVNALIAESSHITTTYNDTANTLTLSINADSIGDTEVSALAISTITGLVSALAGKSDTSHTHNSSAISDFSEAVDDRVAALLQQGSGISLTYNDSANTLTISSTGGGGGAGMSETTYTITSSTIAAGASQTLTFNPELGVIVRKITSDYYARVRIYIDSTSASNDLARTISTELSGEHGCLLEAVLIPANLALDLAPPVVLYKKDSSTPLSITINNLDSSPRVFNIVLSALRW